MAILYFPCEQKENLSRQIASQDEYCEGALYNRINVKISPVETLLNSIFNDALNHCNIWFGTTSNRTAKIQIPCLVLLRR